MRYSLIAASVFALALTACATQADLDKTQNYWQRTDTDSALYMRGPKAQHMLHQDISSCVAELKELQRLGSIRKAIPTGGTQVPSYDPNNSMINAYNTPNRDGPLYAEYYDYVDFEGCMMEQGWQRAVVMTPQQRVDGQDNWLKSLINPDWGGRGDLKPRAINDAQAPTDNEASRSNPANPTNPSSFNN